MRTLLLSLVLIGCGSVTNTPVDAPPVDAPPVDTATPTPDASTAPLALDCTTYCNHLATDCTGANLQISAANCMATCAKFPPGTQADMSGNTLGCRNYHLQNIEVKGMAASTHCPHAGPAGSSLAATTGVCGTSACDDFCAMHVAVCGTDAAPVTGVTHRFADVASCKTACAGFATTPEVSATVTTGNNFACRIYHLTNAAAQTAAATVDTHCGHTLTTATAACI